MDATSTSHNNGFEVVEGATFSNAFSVAIIILQNVVSSRVLFGTPQISSMDVKTCNFSGSHKNGHVMWCTVFLTDNCQMLAAQPEESALDLQTKCLCWAPSQAPAGNRSVEQLQEAQRAHSATSSRTAETPSEFLFRKKKKNDSSTGSEPLLRRSKVRVHLNIMASFRANHGTL